MIIEQRCRVTLARLVHRPDAYHGQPLPCTTFGKPRLLRRPVRRHGLVNAATTALHWTLRQQSDNRIATNDLNVTIAYSSRQVHFPTADRLINLGMRTPARKHRRGSIQLGSRLRRRGLSIGIFWISLECSFCPDCLLARQRQRASHLREAEAHGQRQTNSLSDILSRIGSYHSKRKHS